MSYRCDFAHAQYFVHVSNRIFTNSLFVVVSRALFKKNSRTKHFVEKLYLLYDKNIRTATFFLRLLASFVFEERRCVVQLYNHLHSSCMRLAAVGELKGNRVLERNINTNTRKFNQLILQVRFKLITYTNLS